LADDGLLRRRRVGNANVYWLSDAGEKELASGAR
jgi:DNA-binding transcriptional regulator PaaX